jgi:hypothetical protein
MPFYAINIIIYILNSLVKKLCSLRRLCKAAKGYAFSAQTKYYLVSFRAQNPLSAIIKSLWRFIRKYKALRFLHFNFREQSLQAKRHAAICPWNFAETLTYLSYYSAHKAKNLYC